MAETIVSPGVFTQENDQSFLPAGVAAIGAAIIGPTAQGPAFVPLVVKNFSEYESLFGGLSVERRCLSIQNKIDTLFCKMRG